MTTTTTSNHQGTKGQVTKGANVIEGETPLRDYNGSKDGKPTFETWNIDEWNKHCKDKHLKTNGSAPCAICNTVVAFEGLPFGQKPICEKCLDNVKNYSKNVTIKGEPKSDNNSSDTGGGKK